MTTEVRNRNIALNRAIAEYEQQLAAEGRNVRTIRVTICR
jgi:hypothetical protein